MAANVSVTEKDFQAVSSAALRFWNAGDREIAVQLDELGRKMNRALSGSQDVAKFARRMAGGKKGEEDLHIESPLESAGLRGRC